MTSVPVTPYEERLESIIGLERSIGLHRLVTKQGVSIQSVKSYCHESRWDIVTNVRKLMEDDRQKLHFVLYGIVRQRGTGEVIAYQRPTKGGESRVAGKFSVGIGGHPKGSDFLYDSNGVLNTWETLNNAAWRELWEEIFFSRSHGEFTRLTMDELKEVSNIYFHGFLMDQTEDVGMTHLGVFFTLWVEDDILIDAGEDAIMRPHWATVEKLLEKIKDGELDFENWSRFALQHMHDHPRDVAPTQIPPNNRDYSTLIDK